MPVHGKDDIVISEDVILRTCGEPELPEMGVIEQVWETDPVPQDEIEDRAAEEIGNLDLSVVPEGGEVAVGVGSRGVANIPTIARGAVRGLRERGYEPFIFPAMGSHGGATAEGQRETLAALGVTEDSVDCEIRATMDVEEVGRTEDRGVPVYADANAVAADGIIVINRVKPHTSFKGDVESGLSKMLVIGMGKQKGAKTAHEWALDWSFRNMIPEIASQHLESLPIAGGIALVEDQLDDTAIIEGIPPEGFLDREAELLEIAYDIMPTLPFDELDVAIFDQQGKDISGSGMDTNVIGRLLAPNEPAPTPPEITRIFTRSVTEASHGNSAGIGMSDFIHEDFLRDVDMEKTVINTVTASGARGARIPITVETDYAGIVAACSTIGVRAPDQVRMVRATDTMRLKRFHASTALIEEARERDDLRVVEDPSPIEFRNGELVAPSPGMAAIH